jgi:membrane-bound lytic murein transglycosylase D
MRRAVRKLGTSDIEQIMRRYKSRTFGFASRNFYIEFLAAAEVSKFAERYFGPLVLDEAIDYETHELPHFIRASALASATGVPIAALRAANPALSRLVWRGEKFVPRGYTLRVPRAELQRPLALALGELPADQRLAAQTPDSSHKVRRGDTLSGIAARYGTSARTIASLNKLRSRNRIYPGQLLRLPYNGRSARRAAIVPTAPPADGRYRVRRGDSVSIIAKRFGLQPQQLASLNSLRDRNQIYPGQVLRLRADSPPPEAAPEPEAATPVAALPEPTEGSEPAEPSEGLPSAAEVATSVEADTSELERELLADPADYSVTDGRSLEVQPAETLGHIAEWLDVRASRLRELNNLRYGTPLAVHQRLTLDFGRVTPDEFVRRRLEHHRAVQAAFFERYEISGSRKHTVRRGDSVWVLAQRARVPIWLLQQYNPDLDFATLRSGTSITLPIVRRHGRSA